MSVCNFIFSEKFRLMSRHGISQRLYEIFSVKIEKPTDFCVSLMSFIRANFVP